MGGAVPYHPPSILYLARTLKAASSGELKHSRLGKQKKEEVSRIGVYVYIDMWVRIFTRFKDSYESNGTPRECDAQKAGKKRIWPR